MTYNPTIVAHRGIHDGYPENSLAAFEDAARVGLEWVECDVWPTADGIPVIIHDETLDRTTTGKGIVWWQRFDQLRDLRLRRADGTVDESSRIPSLADIVDLPAKLLVEIKPPDAPAFVRDVVRLLSKRTARQSWMIQSFDEANLLHALAVDRGVQVALLVEDHEALARGFVHQWKNIYMRFDLLDEANIAALRGRSTTIGVWTPTRSHELQRAMDLRADVIITDDPVQATLHLRSM